MENKKKSKVEEICDLIASLTVAELLEFRQKLRDLLGIPEGDFLSMFTQKTRGTAGGAVESAEQTSVSPVSNEIDIHLDKVGKSKFDVVSLLSTLKEIPLKESLALVNQNPPKVIFEKVTMKDFDSYKEKFAKVGAEIVSVPRK